MILTTSDTPEALRDLSIALDNAGQVESDLGNLEAARAAYCESLELARRLRETFPDQPRYERDLAIVQDGLSAVENRT